MNRIAVAAICVFAACLLSASGMGGDEKKLSDEEIAKLLVGKWRFESPPKAPPVTITMTFNKDRTASIETEAVDVKDVRHSLKASAKWKVDKGDIVTTLTKSPNPKEVGKEKRTKVTSISDSVLRIVVTLRPTDPNVPAKELKETFVFKKVK